MNHFVLAQSDGPSGFVRPNQKGTVVKKVLVQPYLDPYLAGGINKSSRISRQEERNRLFMFIYVFVLFN